MSLTVPYLDLKAQIHSLRLEIEQAIARTLDNCSFCLGPDVAAFEQEFASFCRAKHGVGLNSGTSALHLALRLLNIGPGDEVITTPYTFAATSWAISYVGAKPVYVDIDWETFNLDPLLVEAAITPRTKAIIPVHLYGHSCEMEPLLAVTKKHGLSVVEDAAQAHGAEYRNQRVGVFGDLAAFSFYPTKNMGACGEGGMLLTHRDDFAQRARALRDHGSSQRYYHDEVGYNYRMEGMQGAILRIKLKHLETWTQKRREIAQTYCKQLANTPLFLPVEKPWAKHVYHLFVVRHPDREKLRQHLEKNQIGYGLHYPLPLHLQRCYAHLGYKKGDSPHAERAAEECLALPMYAELTNQQIEYVIQTIQSFF